MHLHVKITCVLCLLSAKDTCKHWCCLFVNLSIHSFVAMWLKWWHTDGIWWWNDEDMRAEWWDDLTKWQDDRMTLWHYWCCLFVCPFIQRRIVGQGGCWGQLRKLFSLKDINGCLAGQKLELDRTEIEAWQIIICKLEAWQKIICRTGGTEHMVPPGRKKFWQDEVVGPPSKWPRYASEASYCPYFKVIFDMLSL